MIVRIILPDVLAVLSDLMGGLVKGEATGHVAHQQAGQVQAAAIGIAAAGVTGMAQGAFQVPLGLTGLAALANYPLSKKNRQEIPCASN